MASALSGQLRPLGDGFKWLGPPTATGGERDVDSLLMRPQQARQVTDVCIVK